MGFPGGVASWRRGFGGVASEKAWLPVLEPTLWASGAQGGVWGKDCRGTLDTESSAAPPRNPAVPLQRGDRDTEERLVPGPSAAVRVAAVPLPGWGIPGAARELGWGHRPRPPGREEAALK